MLQLPQYYPLVGWDYTEFSNVSYNVQTQLFTVDGTTNFFATADGGQDPIVGNMPPPGFSGSGNLGRATIRANVNTQGFLVPGSHDACGDGTNADFCVVGNIVDKTGNTPVTLLRGKVIAFQSSRGQPQAYHLGGGGLPCSADEIATGNSGSTSCYYFDFFDFEISIEGGALLNSTDYPTSYLAIDVASIRSDLTGQILPTLTDSYPGGVPVTTFNGNFDGYAAGTNPLQPNLVGFVAYNIAGSAGPTNMAFMTDPCNGTIGGSVLDGFALTGIPGVDVALSGGYLVTTMKATTAADGSYSFSGLCGVTSSNSYTVASSTPTGGYSAVTGFPTIVNGVTMSLGMSGNDAPTPSSVNFEFAIAAVISSNYTTYTQADWGAKPKGQNAAYYLQNYFAMAEPDGSIVVGDPANKTVTMTGQVPVQNFLPQGGLPLPLDKSYVDPPVLKGHIKPHNRLGSLAGETLALQLNVDFSNAGLTRQGLSALTVQSGPFNGQTVAQVLTLANCILGGDSIASCGGIPVPAWIAPYIGYLGPKGQKLIKYDVVEDTVERINKNFLGGTVDRGFLK